MQDDPDALYGTQRVIVAAEVQKPQRLYAPRKSLDQPASKKRKIHDFPVETIPPLRSTKKFAKHADLD